MLRTEAGAWLKVPGPLSDVPILSVLLLVRVIPDTTTLGIENDPVSDCGLALNVWIPDPALNVLLLVMPPPNVTSAFALLFHVAPAAMVTRPVNVLMPVAEDII